MQCQVGQLTEDFQNEVQAFMHGPRAAYRGSYCQAALAAWADRIRGWRSQGLDVYLFFDNDEAGHAAANARTLLGLLGEGRAV